MPGCEWIGMTDWREAANLGSEGTHGVFRRKVQTDKRKLIHFAKLLSKREQAQLALIRRLPV
jgi:hypothetical protein